MVSWEALITFFLIEAGVGVEGFICWASLRSTQPTFKPAET
jgi:hypothetical protein